MSESTRDMAEPYPSIEPYDHGMLDVGDGNLVYWRRSNEVAVSTTAHLLARPGPARVSATVPKNADVVNARPAGEI